MWIMAKALGQPLIEELHTDLSSFEIFELFRSQTFCFFLDSAMDPSKLGRYSLMGSQPFLRISSRGDLITIIDGNSEITVKGDPLNILDRYLETYRLANSDDCVPCASGAAGYLSYDIGRCIERLPSTAVDDINLPESYFCFYDIMLICDHQVNKKFLVSTGFPELDETKRLIRARERIEDYRKRISSLIPGKPEKDISTAKKINFHSNFSHAAYIQAVKRARQYIIDGDIFEVNLSQRFEAEIPVSSFELYRRLRRINPAPFSSYIDFDEAVIVGSSPERFLRVKGDYVETRPIKGTARRGLNPLEDKQNSDWLLSSEKDRAENMMIVDLERNDLGRVCRYGSVKVTELAILEKYPTVFHLTSTIIGRLRENAGRVALLKATFPGGSITGAPKIRAMEIIEELEPTRRSIYTGSLGYLGFDGNLDLNIVIRTFIIKDRQAYFQLGGAIVYDSDPEAEYQETLDKGKALFAALGKSQ
jgi:para-aminobenzoate synthetase component I